MRFVGRQDEIFESRPSLFRNSVHYTKYVSISLCCFFVYLRYSGGKGDAKEDWQALDWGGPQVCVPLHVSIQNYPSNCPNPLPDHTHVPQTSPKPPKASQND